MSAFDDLQSIPSISRLIVSRLIDHRHSADTSNVSCLHVYMYLNKVLLLVGWGVDQYVGGLSVDILAQCQLTIDRVSIDRWPIVSF